MENKISGEFLLLLQQLEAIEFIGISKLLDVRLLDDKEPRDFYILLHDCLEHFEGLSRKKRKEILKILKEAKKEKEKEGKKNNKKDEAAAL